MEEMFTGYETGMSVTTPIKGKLALISEVYLSVWERIWVWKGCIVVLYTINNNLIVHLFCKCYCGHGAKTKYILCCLIG